MKLTAKFLIVLGVIVVFIAFNMNVSVNGSSVININMMSERQNILLLGCVAFVSGIILFATSVINNSSKNQTNSDAETDAGFKLIAPSATGDQKKISLDRLKTSIFSIWNSQDLGGKLIIVSIILAIISFPLYWTHIKLNGANGSSLEIGYHAKLKDFIVVFLLWIYPVKMMIERSAGKISVLTALATGAFFWSLWKYYDLYQLNEFSTYYLKFNRDLESQPSVGMLLITLASATFVAGVIAKHFHRSAPQEPPPL